MRYGEQKDIAKNLVFIDGITRAGKSLFSGIISSLRDVEHIQFYSLLEHIMSAVQLSTMDVETAKALLRTQTNLLVYNLLLSRGVNFRYSDQSGVPNYKEPHIYFDRLSREEGDGVIEDLRKNRHFIPCMTHELLVSLDLLNKMDMDYRMIELFRNPIDNSYSWWKRGWGKRFGKDPRAFTLCIDYRGKLVPWYCFGYEKEWLRLNPMERCVRTVTDLIRKSVKQYKQASKKDKRKIHLLTFEDFVQRPNEELAKICAFLGARTTSHTVRFIRKTRCPRVLDGAARAAKLKEIKSKTSRKIVKDLIELSESYEYDLYGLQRE